MSSFPAVAAMSEMLYVSGDHLVNPNAAAMHVVTSTPISIAPELCAPAERPLAPIRKSPAAYVIAQIPERHQSRWARDNDACVLETDGSR